MNELLKKRIRLYAPEKAQSIPEDIARLLADEELTKVAGGAMQEQTVMQKAEQMGFYISNGRYIYAYDCYEKGGASFGVLMQDGRMMYAFSGTPDQWFVHFRCGGSPVKLLSKSPTWRFECPRCGEKPFVYDLNLNPEFPWWEYPNSFTPVRR